MFSLFYNFIILISFPVALPQILEYSNGFEEPSFVPRVVNGWPAKLGDVPYQLSFKTIRSRYRKTYASFCGGTIIAPSKVISAAHCFEDRRGSKCGRPRKASKKKLERTVAVAGNLLNVDFYRPDSAEHGQWRQLKSMFIHRRYKFPKFDISVGFTTAPFVFNSNVASIPYATKHRDYRGTCLVSGFGRISRHQQSDKLLLAHLELISTSWCSRKHRTNMYRFVCTSDKVADVGKGDSGGPLICSGTNDPNDRGKGVLVGVVSGNRRRAGSFFTRVSSFRRFVETGYAKSLRGSRVVFLVCIIWWKISFLILFYL